MTRKKFKLIPLSKRQVKLAKKHGTPPEFASACFDLVPMYISMDEARDAINKYNRQWLAAEKKK